MKLWARIGLGFIVGVGLLVALQAITPRPEMSWQCKTQGDSGDCVLENKGGASGEVNFDVALVCHDGEHLAHISATVDPHSHVTKIIDGFTPSVGLFSNCAGIDYRHKTVR